MRKSKKSLLIIAVVMVLVVAIAGCSSDNKGGSGTTTEKTYELRMADIFPATHPIPTGLLNVWAEEVNKATNGRVKITHYPVGTLVPPAEIYEGVMSGIADVGNTVFGYTPGRFPSILGFELGGIEYKTAKAGSYAVRDAVAQLKLKELEGTKIMFMYNTGPGQLTTKTPVRTLEDLSGMEIRVPGQTVETIKALGGIPVAMPMNESYEALSRGIVQGIAAPLEALEGWKLAEVTNYITLAPFLYSSNFIVSMNLDVWNSFPKDIQDAIEEVNERIFAEVASGFFDQLTASGYKFATEKHGLEVITLSEAESARWMELLKPLHENYIKEMEQKGLPGRQIIETIIPLAEKYNSMYN